MHGCSTKSKHQSTDDKSGDPGDHEHATGGEESAFRLSPGRAVKRKISYEQSHTNRNQPYGDGVDAKRQTDCEANYSP